MKLGKPQRQHRIARLLETHAVTSQAQLVALLAEEGVEATQTTVSRDLEELGARQGPGPGGRDGLRPARAARSTRSRPRTTCAGCSGSGWWRWRTRPTWSCCAPRRARAHVVGSALDRSGFDGVLGTVAGDDTVLVVAAEATSAGGDRRSADAAGWPTVAGRWPTARRNRAMDARTMNGAQ